ncbi:hypothetical protein [Pseudonocardia abyssalis]|uniref:Uncharacterized protein n=2 Tax=Pseudonocardia abyssalis TaxID=2792008 RepID=A0ABS6V0C0_9PSEU|nr:hypothetical protein [Pseudonocardia abyssalis]MBW0137907.1 hypothetical protein [Pseudonocardia abyssalis]
MTPHDPQPPGRPRFEFRQRPSEAVARRARSVDVSFALWSVAALLGLAAALVMLLDLDGVQAAVRTVVDRDFSNETAVTRDRAVAAAAAVLVGGAFLLGVLTGIAATAMRAGRGGARFVLLLLLAVTVVEIVLAVGVVPPAVVALFVVAAALGVVAAVQMYLPGANRWFAARRR